jgi:AcrR family transcriptional regulator
VSGMGWDTEETKRRIYDAALAEFAAYGPSGTTIDRIAKRARINRERIYAYFGDKSALFTAVLRREADDIAAAVPLRISSASDVGDFAGNAFDYQLVHPALARLVLWEGLTSTDEVVDAHERTALYGAKTEAVAVAQRAGLINDRIPAPDFVFLLIALSSYWSAAPQIARMLASDDDLATEAARRRAAVVEAASRMAAPVRPGHAADPSRT